MYNKIDILLEALYYYENEENYKEPSYEWNKPYTIPAVQDKGTIARKALKLWRLKENGN